MHVTERTSGFRNESSRERLLATLARAVRTRRQALGMTVRELSELSGLSQRFLVQLEHGEANVSVARLADLADALGTTVVELLSDTTTSSAPPKSIIALIGLRGAGKSTLGAKLAERLRIPFVELDSLVEEAAGMRLGAIFELHGGSYYRKLEYDALRDFLRRTDAAVLATGGSIVQATQTYELLRRNAVTVWLQATAEDHMRRVVAQGDARPMANRANAMAELRAILRMREPLYAQADHVINTSELGLEGSLEALVEAVESRT